MPHTSLVVSRSCSYARLVRIYYISLAEATMRASYVPLMRFCRVVYWSISLLLVYVFAALTLSPACTLYVNQT